MRQAFVPSGFVAPKKVILGDYYLVPITTKDTYEDWIVLIANAETIVKTRGGGSREEWPFTCTLEEDLKDLAWLEVCAAYNQLFSYIIRRGDTNEYAGCIYIYPIELFYAEKADRYDMDFSFWITTKEFNNEVYEKIFIDLFKWLERDWPFDVSRIYLRNKLIPEKLQQL